MTRTPVPARVPYYPPQIGKTFDAAIARTELAKISRAIPPTKTLEVVADYTIEATDDTIISNGASSITLLTPVQVQFLRIQIVNINPAPVTVLGTVSSTINPVLHQWDAITIQCDGTRWVLLASFLLSTQFSLADYVLSGFIYPPTSPSLTLMVAGGTALVDGQLVTLPNYSHTYAPNTTYAEDLQADGTITRTIYSAYSVVPATPASGMRLALIVTGASTVLSATDLTTREPMFLDNLTESGFEWEKLLTGLEVTSGPYAGAYRYSPNNRINWYFANTGLWFFVHLIPTKIKAYLNRYIASCDPTNWWIQDIVLDGSNNFVAAVDPDSTDSYAATFLKLAARYVEVTGDWTWWNANLAALKNIATSNLSSQFKGGSPGLIRTFSLTYPYKVYDVAFLMDNSENYAGLNAFATVLEYTGDAAAASYRADATFLIAGIGSLYDTINNVWFYADDRVPTGTSWYPNLTCQVFPELMGYQTAFPEFDADRFNFGYEYLNAHAPQWWQRKYDGFPWLLLGYFALVRRGDAFKASAQMGFAERYFLAAGGANLGTMTISEIGYAKGIMDGLVNQFAVQGPVTIPTPHKTFQGGLRIAGGSVVTAGAALDTTDQAGFLFIPTCPGPPTGVPYPETGTAAMVFDSTNKVLYVYSGGWGAFLSLGDRVFLTTEDGL